MPNLKPATGLWPLRCSGRGWRPQPPGQGLDRSAGLVGRGPGDTEASPDAALGHDRRPIVLDRGTWAGCLEGPAQRRTCCWPPRQAGSEWSRPPGPQATPDAGHPSHGGNHRSIGQAACRRFDLTMGASRRLQVPVASRRIYTAAARAAGSSTVRPLQGGVL